MQKTIRRIKKELFILEDNLDDIEDLKGDLFSTTYNAREKIELEELETSVREKIERLNNELEKLQGE